MYVCANVCTRTHARTCGVDLLTVLLTQVTDDIWAKYLDTNFMSVVRLCRHWLPKLLKANDSGRIINIASEAGWRPISDVSVCTRVLCVHGIACCVTHGLAFASFCR